MRKRPNKATIKMLFVGIVAVALPLVAIPFLRTHSLSAISKDHLFQVVWSREEHAIEQEIRNNANNGRTYREMLARWQVLESDLVRLGATAQVAGRIITSIRGPNEKLPIAHWPVMVKRGWILNKPVWVVITAYPGYIKWPLRGKQLKAPLTRQGGSWDRGIALFDVNGKDITL